MHIHRLGVVVLLSATPFLPRIAAAQNSDSALFHRGQWGAEFNISSGFFGAGALRFTSPTHAWLADLAAAYNHFSNAGGSGASLNQENVSLRLGSRAYHPMGRRLYRHLTFGTSVAYTHQSSNSGASANLYAVGLFGDLGATWFVAPHLGIGARWGATILYLHGKTTVGGISTSSEAITSSLGNVELSGQLTF